MAKSFATYARRRRASPLVAAILVLGGAVACRAAPLYSVATPFGTTRASCLQDALLLATHLDLGQAIKAKLQSAREDLPNVVQSSRARLDGERFAIFSGSTIEIGTDAAPFLRACVAHELVHWYIVESPYEGLPVFMEEGIADAIALDLVGQTELRRQENRTVGHEVVPYLVLYGSRDEWMRLPPELVKSGTRAGFEVVDRIGLEKVAELAKAGAGPMDYVLAAGLTTEPQG